jgi:hypothetical protein
MRRNVQFVDLHLMPLVIREIANSQETIAPWFGELVLTNFIYIVFNDGFRFLDEYYFCYFEKPQNIINY